MEQLNLNWRGKDGSENSSTASSSSSDDDDESGPLESTPGQDLLSSSSSSSSSSSDDDNNDSENEEGTPPSEYTPPQNNKTSSKKSSFQKVAYELGLEQLPPVPDLSKLNINVDAEVFVGMGNVLGIVNKLVTIAALPNTPAYDLDTLLFLDNGKKPLGFVFDVLGQVTSPIYVVRFNTVDDIKELQVQVGTKVYSAPASKHTQYVSLQKLRK